MRMFDHSPWGGETGGISMIRKPEQPPNQDLCPHVFSNNSVRVKVTHLPDDDWGGTQFEGEAFGCTMCGSYLVLYDRRG